MLAVKKKGIKEEGNKRRTGQEERRTWKERYQTYAITKPSLKDGTVFLGPSLRDSGMIRPQLNQISKDGNARDLGKALDLGYVGGIEVPNEEVEGSHDGNAHDLVGHWAAFFFCFSSLFLMMCFCFFHF